MTESIKCSGGTVIKEGEKKCCAKFGNYPLTTGRSVE